MFAIDDAILPPAEMAAITTLITSKYQAMAFRKYVSAYAACSGEHAASAINIIADVVAGINLQHEKQIRMHLESESAIKQAYGDAVPEFYNKYLMLAYMCASANFMNWYRLSIVDSSKHRMVTAAETCADDLLSRFYTLKFIEYINGEYLDDLEEDAKDSFHGGWLTTISGTLPGVKDMLAWCYANQDKWNNLNEDSEKVSTSSIT